MDEENFVSTPFGMIDMSKSPPPQYVDKDDLIYTSSYTREHGWFAHLFNEDGSVK